MDVWFFTEQSHQPAWDKIPGALRVSAPGKYGDPAMSSKLLNTYLDQYVLADQLGMNIMVNEHHIASTCMNPSVQLTLAILARQTKQARLLSLGSLISNRPDPVRVAEEFAVVDSLSGGRLEMGLVKGAGWELFASNSNPVGLMDRYWEAHDLIVKAMSYNEEPFSWEGKHFHYRTINLWPRCVQQPHPPIWSPANSVGSARSVATRGYRSAAFLIGFAAKPIFEAYRERYAEIFGEEPADDRLAYMGLCAVGKTKEDIDRRKASMRAYIASLARSHEAHAAPPGYAPPGDFARLLRGPSRGRMDGAISARYLPNGQKMSDNPTDEELSQAGVMFWGEPQQALDQILAFNEAVGGFGHFLMMGQAADMAHEDVVDSLTLFSEHVLPTLKGLKDIRGTAKTGNAVAAWSRPQACDILAAGDHGIARRRRGAEKVMQEHPKNYSKSANRALDVMDYLAQVGGGARAADIADALGIARSSADQLLKSMVFGGYLVLSAEGRNYYPSLRMARVGHWMSQSYPDLDRHRAIIEDIHAQTGEVVTLSMQNDCFMQMMGAASSGDDDPHLETGAKVPVVGSAIGSAALTTKSPRAINRLVERASASTR